MEFGPSTADWVRRKDAAREGGPRDLSPRRPEGASLSAGGRVVAASRFAASTGTPRLINLERRARFGCAQACRV
jgi:hypothetical protein